MMSDVSFEIFFTTVGNSGNTDGNYVALLLEPIVLEALGIHAGSGNQNGVAPCT